MLRSSLRVLDRHDVDAALSVCTRNIVVNLFVAARLITTGIQTRHGGGELWGWYSGGELRSLCWAGANLVPVEADEEAIGAFAARARRYGRQCSSIVGSAQCVLPLWSRLAPYWGPAREVRPDQPVMVLDGPPLVPADPCVRRSRPDEIGVVIPACVAMFTEEVGYSPVAVDGERSTTHRSARWWRRDAR